MKLNECVEFCGYTSNPLENMAAMDCTIVPSRTEPFGLVALEAQSTGTPVVGFRQSGVAEVIQEGETGLLVEQGDLEGMANAVLSIVTKRQIDQYVQRVYGGPRSKVDNIAMITGS